MSGSGSEGYGYVNRVTHRPVQFKDLKPGLCIIKSSQQAKEYYVICWIVLNDPPVEFEGTNRFFVGTIVKGPAGTLGPVRVKINGDSVKEIGRRYMYFIKK